MDSLKKLALVSPLGLLAGQANAELPEAVTDAIDAAVADVGLAGAAILGVVITIVAFNWIRRVLR